MIVITGSSGQVGTDLKSIFNKKKIYHISYNKKQLNISNKKSLFKKLNEINNLKIIINLAAYTNVEFAESKKFLNSRVNVYGVENICNYISKRKNILLIHISTDYVFDGNKKGSYIETDKTNPLNSYGLSKLKAEKIIKKNLNKFIILRSSWIFSKKRSSFFNLIDQSIKNKKQVNLIQDLHGNPTSAKSLSRAIYKIVCLYLTKNKIKYGFYHFCNHPITNWFFFGKYYAKLKKYNLNKIKAINSKDLNLKAERPKNSCLSSKKFEKEFNFKKVYWKKEVKSFF